MDANTAQKYTFNTGAQRQPTEAHQSAHTPDDTVHHCHIVLTTLHTPVQHVQDGA